jgi:hypothetical protein
VGAFRSALAVTPPVEPAGADADAGDAPAPPAHAAPALLSVRDMVTAVCDGLAKPLSIRIEQVVTSSSTSLPVACRLVDVLAFYVRMLASTIAPGAALLSGLQAVHDRAVSRVEELLQLQAGRLREIAPAFPTTLSVTPLVADVIALAEDILRAHEGSLLAATPAGQRGASTLGVLDVTRIVEQLVDPALESGRACTQGLRLLDSATFLCNQVAALQTALAPFVGAVRIVQRLAAELTAYEESMVQTLSESVLSESGLLAKLALMRAHPGGRLVDVPGLGADEVRAAVAAFVADFSSAGGGPLAVFDRIDNPRARSRLRRDAATVVYEAFCVIDAAVTADASGYGGADGAAALLPQKAQVAVLLELR